VEQKAIGCADEQDVGKHCYMVVIHKKKKETEEEKAAAKLKAQEQAMGIQDEYQAKGFELVSWVQEHKGFVSGFIIAIFLVGIAISGYAYYKQRSEEAASSAYLEALAPIEGQKPTEEKKEKLVEAQSNLIAMAEKYPHVGPTVIANLYAGHLALENKESATAVDLYSKALKSMNAKDELYPLALIGLGYAEENNGKPEQALARFAEVVDLKGNVAKDLALWEAARLAHASNENQRAKTYVERLLDEFPSSVFENNARRLKDSL